MLSDLLIGGALGGLLEKMTKLPSDDPEAQQAFADLWCLYGEAQGHILQHLETVVPRAADIDLSHNSVRNNIQGEDVTTIPNGVETIADAAEVRHVFVAREGFVAHVSGVSVQQLDLTGSMAGVSVSVAVAGRTVQRVPSLDYKRPIMLDRDDRLVLTITNNSGGEVNVAYAIEGWLRSQGRPGSSGKVTGR